MAGIIDGEGSIQLTRRGHKRTRAPSVEVSSVDRELLEWLQDKVGKGTIIAKRTYQEQHTQSYVWSVTNRTALTLLCAILPFMVIARKRRRAQLLTEEYISCTPRNGKYTPELLAAKEDLFARFRAA